MIRQYIIMMLVIFFTFSCHYKLPDDDINLIPYRGSEKLYFKCSNGDIDSIILFEPDRYFGDGSSDHALIRLDNIEVYEIGFSHSDPDLSDTLHSDSYVVNNFVSLSRGTDDTTYFSLDIQAKDAVFDPFGAVEVDEYKSMKPSSLTVPYGTESDVVIFYPDTTTVLHYEENKNYITRVYWSKSKGLLRFDKKECFWELDSISLK